MKPVIKRKVVEACCLKAVEARE